MTESPEPNFDHDDRERQIRAKAMDAAKELLRGLFDGLVIAGTWNTEDGMTAAMERRDGNWYAQNGLLDYIHRKRVAQAQIEAEQQAADEE